ncbi:hypothetical protein GCM10011519_18290 [Marmoricola endophyticus]|uniref:GPP34 family phosphoprotein n=1 Tax=Marmoricola endophyticus TaxID=2040280 RepID=A0A917F595_9ACTN|nr:hypothetical protein GCM10011519_18290 [Marmoricola endophyticus]
MLIAEDLLLLLLDDESGRPAKASHLPVALGGALLVDLVLAEAVQLEPKQGLLGSATVRTTGTAVEDPLLGGALAVVEEKARSPKALVERLGKGSKERVAERLADRGLVEKHEGKVLGLFPTRRGQPPMRRTSRACAAP